MSIDNKHENYKGFKEINMKLNYFQPWKTSAVNPSEKIILSIYYVFYIIAVTHLVISGCNFINYFFPVIDLYLDGLAHGLPHEGLVAFIEDQHGYILSSAWEIFGKMLLNNILAFTPLLGFVGITKWISWVKQVDKSVESENLKEREAA